MSTGNSYIPLSDVLFDAAAEVFDPEFKKAGGLPFYQSAAQRGVGKMYKDTSLDSRSWSTDIPASLIIELPSGLEEIDAAYLYNGDNSNVSFSQKLYIKRNMYRLGGSGYLAGDKWYNYPDPLQFSHGAGSWGAWSSTPPPWVFFAGRYDGHLFLSDTCTQFNRLNLVYQGIGVDCFGDEPRVPYWMRDAITDYVVYRAAQKLRAQDRDLMREIIREKEIQLNSNQGSWNTAMIYGKRMDRKTREDTRNYLESFGGIV
jgi:hypothetical protein